MAVKEYEATGTATGTNRIELDDPRSVDGFEVDELAIGLISLVTKCRNNRTRRIALAKAIAYFAPKKRGKHAKKES